MSAPRPEPRQADDAAALARRINTHIEAAWREHNVMPAALADDAEFLRRISLDLAGRIPSVWEVRAFLEDKNPDKRRRVVDQLLESPAFFSHFADTWRTMMIPEAGADFELRSRLARFDLWLRQRLIENAGYDELVRQVLTYSFTESSPIGPDIFYRARGDIKAEDLAAATSRVFLGVRLECAQCHNHPFSHWKQEQFWGLAAFFAGLEGTQYGPIREAVEKRTIQIPDSDKLVEARFLVGQPPDFSVEASPRQALAGWITSRQNRYFARTAANRVWAQLFGIGTVDPPDDFDEANPPSHPELLDELAREFAAHNFDFRFLMRAITASRAYQLTSRQSDISQENPRLFARYLARGLSADQLFDSLAQATGHYDATSFWSRHINMRSPRLRFRELFETQAERPAESQTTILQALAMMNGEFVESATDRSRGATLSAVLDAPFLTTAERIETLYLATLSRPPRAEELQRMLDYVKSKSGPTGDNANAQSAAFADIFWALLNSAEFAVNH